MATLPHSAEAPKPARSRTWGTIVYQESAPDGWMRILEETCVPCAVSPLHDRDVPESGIGLKKPHWHVLFHFDSVKSRPQIFELVKPFCGVGAEPIKSIGGAVVYLWHGNSPEKAQYSRDGCTAFNGFQIDRWMPKPDRDAAFCEVVAYIEENDICYYSDLVRSVIKDRSELLAVCRRDSYSIVSYLKSRSAELAPERPSPRGSSFRRAPDGFEF